MHAEAMTDPHQPWIWHFYSTVHSSHHLRNFVIQELAGGLPGKSIKGVSHTSWTLQSDVYIGG